MGHSSANEPGAVTVRVPATSANLGPGFDTLGLALEIYDEYTFRPGDEAGVRIDGEAAGETPTGPDNLALRAAVFLADRLGAEFSHMDVEQDSAIPVSRGLGASAAGVVTGLLAANHALGDALSIRELAGLAIEIEGHADNVLPALVGGLVVVAASETKAEWMRVDYPASLQVALAVPELRVTTNAAREVLPDRVPFADAIHNVSRTALLVSALQHDRLDLLATAMDDRLHEPYRRRLHPALDAMLAAARGAGAMGAALSGSGSTVIALCQGDAEPAAAAMLRACQEAGIECRQYVCSPAAEGAAIVSK